jgi:hypothetical protein
MQTINQFSRGEDAAICLIVAISLMVKMSLMVLT